MHVGSLQIKYEGATVLINYGFTFATLAPLADVGAARPASFGGLNAPAVEHSRPWLGLAPGPLPVSHDQGMVDPPKQSLAPSAAEVAERRAARREIFLDQPPRDAAP